MEKFLFLLFNFIIIIHTLGVQDKLACGRMIYCAAKTIDTKGGLSLSLPGVFLKERKQNLPEIGLVVHIFYGVSAGSGCSSIC